MRYMALTKRPKKNAYYSRVGGSGAKKMRTAYVLFGQSLACEIWVHFRSATIFHKKTFLMKQLILALILGIFAFSTTPGLAQNDKQKERTGIGVAPPPAAPVQSVTLSTQPTTPSFQIEEDSAVSQVVEISELTPQNIFGALVDPIYLALVTLLGYLSAFIPGVKKIQNTWLRVFAVALVIGLGLYIWHGDFWKIAVTYVISSGLYVTIFRNIVKTPKPSVV